MPASFEYEDNEAFDKLVAEGGLFESNVRFLVFAASVGFDRNRRVSDPDQDREIRWSYVNKDQQLAVIVDALAYADHEDPDVILDDDRQIETLTCYGAGGARVIKEEVIDEPGANLDNLIAFIKQHRDEEKLSDQVGVLEEIEEEISSLRSTTD